MYVLEVVLLINDHLTFLLENLSVLNSLKRPMSGGSLMFNKEFSPVNSFKSTC